MTVSAGGVSVGAPLRSVSARRTRREVARGLFASAVVALAPFVVASRRAWSADGPEETGTAFDEIYQGRRIQGFLMPLGGLSGIDVAWHVTVDGHPLHLMRRADGSWLSMLDHYSWFRTPLEATRAAVDELGPRRRLRDLAPGPLGGGHPHQGAEHDVHA
ncbi:tyrosinase family oxidase copper chaperone [Streptomyces blattellae]|uniref:tyrosinase family oxidase copper chaperone n=1 Tax=Streptomyces blattellae TaxID=2569855 RepID=UPI0012B94055|nr:tyrosinase family oxidase copper chaperone [Streptomyces blattellae]